MNTIASRCKVKSQRHIGIDVGKTILHIYVYELALHWRTTNDQESIKAPVARLSRYNLTRVQVEAAGGYERALVEACAARELPVVAVQPIQIRLSYPGFSLAQGLSVTPFKVNHLAAALR